MKKAAVLGGGNGAHALAAELALNGFEVNMYEMPAFKRGMQTVFDTREICVSGQVNGRAKLAKVTDDIDEAVAGVRYVFLIAPAFTHDNYAKLLHGHLHKDQLFFTFPGAFCSLLMKKYYGNDEDCPICIDSDNLPYDARLMPRGSQNVSIFGRNAFNIGIMPAEAGTPELVAEIRETLPFFEIQRVYNDVIECGLCILNPDWHAGPVLFNISNIESPHIDFYLYEMGWTPSACRLNIELDKERKAVGAALGYKLRPMEDLMHKPEGYEWTMEDLYAAGHGNIGLTPIKGPNDIQDRYLTEDIPYGHVPWASLAELAGVEMPLTNALISIINVVHQTDWRKEGCTAEMLGIAGMDKASLLAFAKTGRK